MSRHLDIPDRRRKILEWVAMTLFVLTALIFVTNQQQQPDVTYATQVSDDRAAAADPRPEMPTYEQIAAEYGDQRFVVLPGGYAVMDEPLVSEWMDKAGASQVLVLPAVHPDDQLTIDAPSDVVVVAGTHVTYDGYATSAASFEEVRASMGARDVTSSVIALLAHAADEPDPDGLRPMVTREPSPEEAAAVVADLQDDGIAFLGGVEPFERPDTNAFTQEPLYVVAPSPAPGEAAVDYSAVVADAFPGRPVVSMTGLWIDYRSEEIEAIEPAIAASFYGQFEERLSKYAYSQETVLRVSLDRVEQFRASGMFDREMPYVAPDPLNITLPILPWICAGLAAVMLALALAPRTSSTPRSAPAMPRPLARRFAGLSDLAVEVNALVTEDARPAFVRASRALVEARDSLEEPSTTSEDVEALLERAESDLDEVAEITHRPGYRPAISLEGGESCPAGGAVSASTPPSSG
ncbi:hypothetical protein [Blastococcus sp. Marseille-P5729]|uniref:hypothetical protein n=1 Tax=Blastococcus sp. Marseille-P5729 TaxID=2086582 RepID=UPI000D101E47|nr:hypothetical protein [Blastococcus sp. Marseille-P5729]